MEKSVIIEKFGGLVKQESLTCLEDKSLMPNACLLEAVSPFSGYYSEEPGASKPLYLFLVLEGNYSAEDVARATINVKKKAGFTFDAAFGKVSLFEHTCPVIRIRDLENYANIRELQLLYHEEGLEYRKRIRSFSNEKGIITLNKLFYLGYWGDELFIDRSQPHHGYFKIPRHLDFEEFNKIITEVKYETSLLYFDAAYAWYYEGEGIQNMVRIYREGLTKEKLAAIRNKFLSVMK